MKNILTFIFTTFFICAIHGQNIKKSSKHNKDPESEKILDSIHHYYLNGYHEKSLSLNIAFLESTSTKNNPFYLYEGYKSLGYIYLNIGDSILAKECFVKSSKYAFTLNDTVIIASTYMDFGNLYAAHSPDNENALTNFDMAIKLYHKGKDTFGIALAYYNKIIFANKAKKYDIAYASIKKARALSKYADPTFDIDLDIFEGEYYLSQKNYTKADYYFEKTIATAIKDSLDFQLKETYKLYSKSLFNQDKFKKAYIIKDKFEAFLLEDEEQVNQAKSKELSLDFLIKNYREQALESQNKARLQKEIADNNYIINKILILLISCFTVLLITFFYAYNKRKKLIKLLEAKNKEYLRAKKETDSLLKSKNNFFSTVSHEIRTPLYGIISLSNMLHEDKKLEAHKDDISALKFSADYLLALINDVLQINKIDSNSVEEKKTSFDLRLLIKKISQSFDYITVKNNNKIHVEIDEKIPSYIKGNSTKLTQVLLNIIGNACKFTQNGDVYIKAELVKVNNTNASIKFYIKDNGIGIPLEKQKTIFEEYSQAETLNYTYQGTGLGLSIVKKILKTCDSDIYLESEPNKGTQFYFTLLFDVVKTLDENQEKNSDLSLLKNKTILVVEDNLLNQKITKRILENNSLKCDTANNGNESILMAKENNYDLILMDINMPIKDGYKATEEIRKFNTNVPIIALTASDDEEIFTKALKSGMNDVVIKPYDLIRFMQKIYEHIIIKNKKT